MRLKPQYVFIIAVIGVLVIYFIGMSVLSSGKKAEAKPTESASGPPGVQVRLTPQTTRQVQVVMRGRTEAARSVVIRSETAGVVTAAPAAEGAFVKQGQVLCRLSVDARQASLDQARADREAGIRNRDFQVVGAGLWVGVVGHVSDLTVQHLAGDQSCLGRQAHAQHGRLSLRHVAHH